MGYSPWGCKELDTTEQTAHTCLSQHPRISLDHEPKVVGGALPVKTEGSEQTPHCDHARCI